MGRSGGLRRLEGRVPRVPTLPLSPLPSSSSGNIYWTDQGFDVIEVARLQWLFPLVVISQEVWTTGPEASQSTRRRGEEQGGLTSPHSWFWSGPGPLWPTGLFSTPCSGD